MLPSLVFLSLGKNPQPSTIGLWLNRMGDINKMKEWVLGAQHKYVAYAKTWTLWNMFVNSEEGRVLFAT